MSLLCHPPLFNFNLLEELMTRTSEFGDDRKKSSGENETVAENYEYSKNTVIPGNSVNDINNDDSNNNKKDKINDKYVDIKNNKYSSRMHHCYRERQGIVQKKRF